jgi:mannose/fructose/N-acetylgalactosamine-specific phosphotransferase system component IID
LVGFFAVSLGGISTVFVALIGLCLAFLHLQFTSSKFETNEDEEEEEDETEEKAVSPYREGSAFPTKASYFWWCMKYNFFYRISQCLEYFYGTGTAWVMLTPLKRIYGKDEEGLKVAYKRQLKPYITNMCWGTELTTIALVMEEDIAKNGDKDGSKGEAIESLKTGLMGPMAGLGDTIEVAIMMPIFKSICYPLAQAGNILGAWPFTLWFGYQLIPSYITGRIGYEQGKKGLTKLLASSSINKVLYGAGILGIILMGAMCASYCSLNFTISWTNALGVVTDINSVLNSMIPNLATLLYLGLVYILLSKGVSFIKIMLGVVAFGILGALIGIV